MSKGIKDALEIKSFFLKNKTKNTLFADWEGSQACNTPN